MDSSTLPKMSDLDPVPVAPVDIDRWKIILGVALPVALIVVGTATFFGYRNRQSSREKKKDLEDVGNMLEELRTNQAQVAAMRQSLQTGIELVKAMETELTVRETTWSKHVFLHTMCMFAKFSLATTTEDWSLQATLISYPMVIDLLSPRLQS